MQHTHNKPRTLWELYGRKPFVWDEVKCIVVVVVETSVVVIVVVVVLRRRSTIRGNARARA